MKAQDSGDYRREGEYIDPMSEAGGDLPVYLVGFPQDTPILGLLPADFGAAACFDDCPAAADFFREREVAGPTPTILVNCLPFYRRVDLLKSDSDGVLLEQLSALREAVGDGGVKLLLPEEKNGDQNLLIDLMSQGFYDFWFLTALSTALLREILSESRDFRALEAYLSTLPLPQIRAAAAGKGWAGKLGLARWQKPEWLADLPAKTKKYVFRRLLSRGPAVPGIEGEAETDFPIWPEGELDEVMSGEPGWETGEGMAGEPGWETGEVMSGEPGWETGEVMSWALGRETGEVMSGAPGRERGEGMSGATDGGPRPASAASTGAGAGWPSRLAAPAREAAAARGEKGPTGGAKEKRRPLTAPFLAGRTRRRFGGGPDPGENQDLSGGTVAFFSAEDSLLPYSLAVLTGLWLAGSGRKTLLVELPGGDNRLGVALGLRHPEKNLRQALLGYQEGRRGDWRRYCVSGPQLAREPLAFDQTSYAATLPEDLLFLPDQHTKEDLLPCWEGFLGSLIHWAILEERCFYILYVGFGEEKAGRWKKGLVCGQNVVGFPPWPAGFNAAFAAQKSAAGNCLPAFDGSWGPGQIKKEAAAGGRSLFIVPPEIKKDFLSITAFQGKWANFSPESRRCLETLCRSFHPAGTKR